MAERLCLSVENQGTMPVTLKKIEVCEFALDWAAKRGWGPQSCHTMRNYYKHDEHYEKTHERVDRFRSVRLEQGIPFEANWKFDELGQIGLSREQLHGRWFVVTTTVGKFTAKIDTMTIAG